MTLNPAQAAHARELLGELFAARGAADKIIESYFRAHKRLGVRDRGAVAEIVYACMRRRRSLAHLAGSETPAALIAAYLLQQGSSARALEPLKLVNNAASLVERVRTYDRAALPFAIRADLPDWLAQALIEQLGEDRALNLAQALNEPAPLDLRVNALKADRAAVQERLAAEGFSFEPTPFSPLGLRRRERSPVFQTEAFRAGWFEVQDEGSQLISVLLELKRREHIVDFCAGAGGKTLHLGALLANTGAVYAFDVLQKRLDKLKPRLIRAGLDNVRSERIDSENDARLQRLAGKMDRVLVDAPCSGTGTLRRNPDIKWRPIDLPALTKTQAAILAAAARLVKGGGRLVYATCSLLSAENDAIVTQFLAQNPEFELVSAQEILARRQIAIPQVGDRLRLNPLDHGTDGFYAAALVRRPSS